MTVKYCDVCGEGLELYDRHTSDVFDYDLCENCKAIERRLNFREEYLNILKVRWRELHESSD